MAAVLAASLWAFFRPYSPTAPQPQHSRKALAASEVVARCERAIRTLAPDEGELRVQAQEVTAPALDGKHGTQWQMLCTNPAGETRMHLSVDGETGDILQVTVMPSRRRGNGRTPVTSGEATRSAERLVSAIEPFGRGYSLEASSCWKAKTGWVTRLDGAGARAFAIIDGDTGGLKWLSAGRRPAQTAMRGANARS